LLGGGQAKASGSAAVDGTSKMSPPHAPLQIVVPNLLVAEGHGVRVFEVDKYVGWGTPRDLDDFRNWERYFARLDRRLV